MTSRITLAGSEVRVADHIYNGTGTNAHPANVGETISEVKLVGRLTLLTTGDIKRLHGDFWLEPDEQTAVIRYPKL